MDLGTLAAEQVLHRCRQLARRSDALRQDDPETLHRLRITERRLRVALQEGRPAWPIDAEPAIEDLRQFHRASSPARDLDVWIARFPQMDLHKRRAHAWAEMAPTLGDGTLARAAQLARAATKSAGLGNAKKRARKRLRRRKAAIAAAWGDPLTSDAAQMHECRKAIKKARYALDFYAPILRGAKESRKLLAKYQEALGQLQDAAAGAAILGATELAELNAAEARRSLAALAKKRGPPHACLHPKRWTR